MACLLLRMGSHNDDHIHVTHAKQAIISEVHTDILLHFTTDH